MLFAFAMPTWKTWHQEAREQRTRARWMAIEHGYLVVAACCVGTCVWGGMAKWSLSWSESYKDFWVLLIPWLWVLGLMCVVIACQLSSVKSPGPVVAILRWGVWQSLSRLTFGTYLIHPALAFAYYSLSVRPNVYSGKDIAVLWPAILLASYILAAVAYLIIERPCANLVAILQTYLTQPTLREAPATGGGFTGDLPFRVGGGSWERGRVTVREAVSVPLTRNKGGYGSLSTVES